MTNDLENKVLAIIGSKGADGAAVMDILDGLAPMRHRQAVTPIVDGLVQRGLVDVHKSSHAIGQPPRLTWIEGRRYRLK